MDVVERFAQKPIPRHPRDRKGGGPAGIQARPDPDKLLEEYTADLVARGMDPAAAREYALHLVAEVDVLEVEPEGERKDEA